ncbi:MAG: alpha/beta fold hydrolase [Candidatus Obscuribacterales bacterium]|nr:alpha/beta fold hydrolase [Candidatus Obscuribacterales bacterium]
MDLVADNTQKKESGESKKRTGVVLIHGLTGTPVEMKPLEKYLRKLGVDVENVLLAGHGAGNDEIIASTWTQWLDSVREGAAKILERNERVIACGLSMGAVLAACLAAEESRVSALVMLSPTLVYDGSVLDNSLIDWVYSNTTIRDFVKGVVKVAPVVGKKCYWEELPPYGIRDERIQKQITKSIEAAKAGGNNEFGVFRTYYSPLVEMLDMVEYARTIFSKVKVPVLQMHSLDDTIASIHNSTEVYLNLGAGNKALFLLTGCDHVMTLDLQRHLVHKMIGRFVQGFSEINAEYKTVRSIVSPVLEDTRYAKGGNISALISPEMHGLNKEEWKALYPGRRFAHMASVADVKELHSIVLRDCAQPLMSLPVFVGEYGQTTKLKKKSLFGRSLSGILSASSSKVFGLGSYIPELPGLGLNKASSADSQSKALSHLIRIVESLARSSSADAFANVQNHVPDLPLPAVLHRANDAKPIRLNDDVYRLLAGVEKFSHRSQLRKSFARFIRVAVPKAPKELESLQSSSVAAGVG